MKKLFLILAAFAIPAILWAQTNTLPIGSRSLALANSTVAQENLEAIFYNQAALANFRTLQLGIFYDDRYLIDDLSTKTIAGIFSTTQGNFAFQFNTFGKQQWLENNLGFCYSRNLHPKISASIGFDYFTTRIPESLELAKNFGFNLGVLLSATEKTKWGCSLHHLGLKNQENSEINILIPWDLKFGGSTQLNSSTTLSYQIQKVEQEEIHLMAGIDWQLVENVNFRFGLSTQANHFSTGIGYKLQNFSFNLAFLYHQYLGVTPSASIIFTPLSSKL